jgi:hypothetical protein
MHPNTKFVQGSTLIRRALIEQHRSEGDLLAAAGALDSMQVGALL